MSNFDVEVAAAVSKGWVPVLMAPPVAIFTGPATRVNHVLHAILTLLTVVWVVVWVIVASSSRSRQILTLTDTGTTVLWSIRRAAA